MKVEITIDAPSCRKGILQEIREDYEALQHQESCDVLLNVGGQILRAHSFILSRHSEVFRAMLSGSMVEGQTKTVEIVDSDASTIQALLNYLYTSNVPSQSVGTFIGSGSDSMRALGDSLGAHGPPYGVARSWRSLVWLFADARSW